jgi:hypothetical protein
LDHQVMMRLVSCLVVLTGCNMPSPAFRDLPATRVTIEGSVFDVRQRRNRAEAIRVNPQYAPRFGPIKKRAAIAIQQVSGCRVVSISGDQALAFGRLDCGKGTPYRRYVPCELECVSECGLRIRGIGQVRVDRGCDPV